MNLEKQLPDLLHHPWDSATPPISAAAVIARARRRLTRRRRAAGAAALILAAGTGLLADQLASRTTTGHPMAASPVRAVALEQRLSIVDGAQMWLTSVDTCVQETAGWRWDPIGITGPTNCARYRTAGRNVNTPPGFYEAMGLIDPADHQTMPIVGTYTGPMPASIVISAGKSSTIATLVTSPQLHSELGYYAYLHYPLPRSFPSTAPGGTGPRDAHLGPSITETAYDTAGHVLATVTWPGVELP